MTRTTLVTPSKLDTNDLYPSFLTTRHERHLSFFPYNSTRTALFTSFKLDTNDLCPSLPHDTRTTSVTPSHSHTRHERPLSFLPYQTERRHIEQQNVLHVAHEHAALDGRAHGEQLVQVDALGRLAAEEVLDELLNLEAEKHIADTCHVIAMFLEIRGRETSAIFAPLPPPMNMHNI